MLLFRIFLSKHYICNGWMPALAFLKRRIKNMDYGWIFRYYKLVFTQVR